jgi:Ni/Fe-hydrogenase subunit HybB-like protein
MLENTLTGSKKYWGLLAFLAALAGTGLWCYLRQLQCGLGITGMSRDVSWGLYIAQFTFVVGIAASAVMLLLPYYLHNYRVFGKITVLGEFLAVASVVMSLAFVMADLGRPDRAFNVLRYPSPRSLLFWDLLVLSGYLFLNIFIAWTVLAAERESIAPPSWIKPFIYLSIPWAISIHTVTAFIYAGLPGRGFWLTALMAPRFLASAFASGPALLVLLSMTVKKFTRFDPGKEAIETLATIISYAMAMSVFFYLVELFTVFYSQIPGLMNHCRYLFAGLQGKAKLVPWMWTSAALAVLALVMLINPKTRKNPVTLGVSCVAVFVSIWIEKGMSLVVTGFIPSPLGKITEYTPTVPEVLITVGIWGLGFLILTILYKDSVGGERGRS